MRERTPFGEAIQKLRVEGNLSMAQMAEVLGYSKAFVSATELGLSKPNLKYINKVADLFCVDPEELKALSDLSVYVQKSGMVHLKTKVSKDKSKLANKFLNILNELDSKSLEELDKFLNKLS